MAVTVNAEQRARILRYASQITPAEVVHDPVEVGKNAIPLLEWAEQADGASDLDARMAAFSRQYGNTPPSKSGDGDPQAFVTASSVHYAFIVSGAGGAKTGVDEYLEEADARMAALAEALELDDDEEARG